MAENILDRNTESLKERTGIWSQDKINQLLALRKKEEYQRYYIDSAMNEHTIIAVKKDKDITYLNSRYNDEYAAEKWVEGIEDIKYKSVLIVLGLANGIYAKTLLKRLGAENDMIIYEPDPYILLKNLEEIDLTQLWRDQRVHIFTKGINEKEFRDAIGIICPYERINYTQIVALPNYSQLFGEEIARIEDIVLKEVRFIEAQSSTYYHLGEEMNDNMIDNLEFVSEGTTIDILKERISQVDDYENIPAIIVGAGPSLKKNIEELKNSKNKAFIIATDSAIKPMLQYEIIPDLLVTIDPHKPMELFEDERVRRLPYVVCLQTRYEVLKEHHGKNIFFTSDLFMYGLYQKFGYEISTLETGGSVACNGFSLARFLGFKNIVLIGQDLAFTDNKKHIEGTYKEKAISEEEKNAYAYVKDIDGNELLTYANFKIYKEWFEAEIAHMHDFRVINATEGGACILGAENRTLKYVNDALCTKDVDFEQIIKKLPQIFEKNVKENLDEYIASFPKVGKKLRKLFREIIEDYKRIDMYAFRGKIDSEECKNAMKHIDDYENQCAEEMYMELVKMYAKQTEYDMLLDVYDIAEDEKSETEDIHKIVNKGIALIKAYIDANEKVLKRLKKG